MDNRPSKHAHWRVKETAEVMAHELYDHMMHDNQWYAAWQAKHPELNSKQLEQAFVDKNMAILLPQARAILAGMLNRPYDEGLKESIMEALVLDATLVKGRVQ